MVVYFSITIYTCERLLADLLESPYADAFKQDKGIDGTIAYYFWISVIWRMNSCRKNFGFQLDESTSKALHKMLLSYLDNNGQLNERNKPNPDIFKYKLLYCPNYCKDTQKGFQYCNYKNNVLTFIISDFIVIVYINSSLKIQYMAYRLSRAAKEFFENVIN